MTPTSRREVVQFRIPGDTKYVSMVRRGMASIACSLGLDHDSIADIELSVSEAIANAIEHGCPDRTSNLVLVSCTVDTDKLIIDVRDEGPGFEPGPRDPSLAEERGRGLKLIYLLMDKVEVSKTRRGAKLRMVKNVGADNSACPAS